MITGIIVFIFSSKVKLRRYKAVFLCGDPNYYHRFGFKSISESGLTNPDIPEPYVMGYELEAGALDHVTGIAKLV